MWVAKVKPSSFNFCSFIEAIADGGVFSTDPISVDADTPKDNVNKKVISEYFIAILCS
jgi:hypothetical protein